MHPRQNAPDLSEAKSGVVDWRPLKHKKDKPPGHLRKIMSHCWLKSPRPVLLPVEENEQCGTAMYRAEFPSIGSCSLERKGTRGGLGGWRYSQSHWKPEQNSECWHSLHWHGCE